MCQLKLRRCIVIIAERRESLLSCNAMFFMTYIVGIALVAALGNASTLGKNINF